MNDLTFNSPNSENSPEQAASQNSLADSFATNSSVAHESPNTPINNTPNSPNSYESKGLNLASILLLIIFLGITAYGGFQLYQIKNTENEIELARSALEDARTASITDTETISVDFRNRFLTQKKNDQLFWSNIITNIESSVPEIRRTNINSISGSENGNVNISFNTTPQSTSPFRDTADLITAFKSKAFFENVFIPNVSSSVTSAGASQLTYNLRLTYVRADSETAPVSISAPQQTQTQTQVSEDALLDPATIQEIVSQQQESNEE